MATAPNMFEMSANQLRDYAAGLGTENEKMIVSVLGMVAREVDGNQQLIHRALGQYLVSISQEPSEEEFYDLVAFLGKFTTGFHESRIDLSSIDSNKLSSWVNRHDAPAADTRKNLMVLMVESAMKNGVLSGVGIVNEFIGLQGDNVLQGSWSIDPCEGSDLRLNMVVWDISDLPVRIRNASNGSSDYVPATEARFFYLGDLLLCNEQQLRRTQNIGVKTISELKNLLAPTRFRLNGEDGRKNEDLPEFREFLAWRANEPIRSRWQ